MMKTRRNFASTTGLLLLTAVCCPLAAWGDPGAEAPAKSDRLSALRSATTMITLRSTASRPASPPVLGDVAQVQGPRAEELQRLALTPLPKAGGITLAHIETILTQARINRAAVALRGAASCAWVESKPVSTDAGSKAASPSALADESVPPLAKDDVLTLRTVALETLARLAETPLAQLRVTFPPAQARELDMPLGEDRLEVEPLSATGLGRVPLVLRRYQGQSVVSTLRLTAEVARRHEAYVLARQITRGSALTPADLQAQTIYLTSAGAPVTDLTQLNGQVTHALLRKGAVLMQDQLEPARIVQRGEMMSLRCLSGDLAIATQVRALADAALNQVITVRQETTRQVFQAKVTAPGEGILLADAANPEMKLP